MHNIILKQKEFFYVFDALVNVKKYFMGGGNIIRVTGKIYNEAYYIYVICIIVI